MTSYRDAAAAWIVEDPDPETVAELKAVLAKGDERELRERFDGTLEFGTAGLRGLLGAGPQRMNRVLVRKVTAGLAAYVKAHVPDAAARGLLIGHDALKNYSVISQA